VTLVPLLLSPKYAFLPLMANRVSGEAGVGFGVLHKAFDVLEVKSPNYFISRKRAHDVADNLLE
jgi:hypothetical protein